MANQNQTTQSLTEVLRSPMVKKRFDDILGNNSGSFMSTILTIVNNSSRLKMCSTGTILSAASTAAALKLPITPSLGFAYIVPYKVKDGYQAQFQIGWKGLVQLAQRSNLYHRLHAGKVYEGQIEDIDFITGDPIRGKKISPVSAKLSSYSHQHCRNRQEECLWSQGQLSRLSIFGRRAATLSSSAAMQGCQ